MYNYCNPCIDEDLHKCGGISPVKATDDMTKPVGQRNGKLFTFPDENGLKIQDSSEIVVNEIDEETVELYLDNAISSKIARSLVTPLVAPANRKLVAVNTANAQELIDEPVPLPAVSASDNGKFLRVVNGAWAAEAVPDAAGEEF